MLLWYSQHGCKIWYHVLVIISQRRPCACGRPSRIDSAQGLASQFGSRRVSLQRRTRHVVAHAGLAVLVLEARADAALEVGEVDRYTQDSVLEIGAKLWARGLYYRL